MTWILDISTHRSTSEKNFAAHLQSWHVFFGSLFLASILRFEELTQLLYILLLILEKDLPWSHVQHELGIQTTSIQRLNIFRQPWLKTLPAEVSYLSSNISTSAKFLISMAHLLDPKGSVITPPLLNLSEHLQRTWTSGKCQMLEMRARSSYVEKLTPGSGRWPQKNKLVFLQFFW